MGPFVLTHLCLVSKPRDARNRTTGSEMAMGKRHYPNDKDRTMAINTAAPSTSQSKPQAPAQGKPMTNEEMQAIILQLQAQNAAMQDKLKAAQTVRALSMKVSEKGAASVYGLGRFPVTLYKEQWVRLLDKADDIREWIKANDGALKAKGE